jgi:hypothetical protein
MEENMNHTEFLVCWLLLNDNKIGIQEARKKELMTLGLSTLKGKEHIHRREREITESFIEDMINQLPTIKVTEGINHCYIRADFDDGEYLGGFCRWDNSSIFSWAEYCAEQRDNISRN